MDRRKTRSLTQVAWFGRNLEKWKKKIVLRHPSVCQEIEKTPVYTPGPKPSVLLLEFLNSQPEKKVERIQQIKECLHGKSSSWVNGSGIDKRGRKT